ncbi:hypothetical protein EJB05_19802, partial [Eragrostis curvula]
MKVERDLHMSRGNGESSYATNSRLQAGARLLDTQEKSILKTRPVLHKAVAAAHASLDLTAGTMVVADLGCSSGPNTFLFVSEVLGAIADQRKELQQGGQPVHVQFFLNDLPGNDFNLVFQSLEMFKNLSAKEKGAALPPYYVAGLPGSFYTRLFPDRGVHLFHSSYCLMWRSKVPEELSTRIALNEGNIYIWEATTPSVVKLYRNQFLEDFSLVPQAAPQRARVRRPDGADVSRQEEQRCAAWRSQLHVGPACPSSSVLSRTGHEFLLLDSWQGRVEKEKLDSFNLPFYAPSVDEVKEVIKKSDLFDINHIELFESNWDPHDDLDGDLVLDNAQSGPNVAKCIRAVVEPLIMHHFGEHILDDLFEMFAQNVAKHLQKVKTKYPVIVLSLKASRGPKYPSDGGCYPIFAQSQLT